MASALSLRADTEFTREVKGEEPREKGKATTGLRTRDPPNRRLLSEPSAEPRVAGRADSVPSSTNQEAHGPSSETCGASAADGRPTEGLRGCSSGGAGLPKPGAAADIRPLGVGARLTSVSEGPELAGAGDSAAHSSGRVAQGLLGKRERRGEDAMYDEGEEGDWETKIEEATEARLQEVTADEAEQAEEGEPVTANGRHAARSQTADHAMSSGIEGIFRTGGITRRRTRPNRFSARPGKTAQSEATSAEVGQKEAGLHADQSAGQGAPAAAGAGLTSAGRRDGDAEAEAEAFPGTDAGRRKEAPKQAPRQGWNRRDEGGDWEETSSALRNAQAEALSLPEAEGDPETQVQGQEHSPAREDSSGRDPVSGSAVADSITGEHGNGYGGSGERSRGGRGRGRGRPRKGFKRSGQAASAATAPGGGSRDTSSAVSGSEDNGATLPGASTLGSSPTAEGPPAAELAAPADGEEREPRTQASTQVQGILRPPSPALAAAGDAPGSETAARPQRKGARSSPPMPFAPASNGATTPHVTSMVTRQR